MEEETPSWREEGKGEGGERERRVVGIRAANEEVGRNGRKGNRRRRIVYNEKERNWVSEEKEKMKCEQMIIKDACWKERQSDKG